jgi:hypothetical protein
MDCSPSEEAVSFTQCQVPLYGFQEVVIGENRRLVGVLVPGLSEVLSGMKQYGVPKQRNSSKKQSSRLFTLADDFCVAAV